MNIIEFQVSNPLMETNNKHLNSSRFLPMTIENIDFGKWIGNAFPEEYSKIKDKEHFINWYKKNINGSCVVNSYREVVPLNDVSDIFDESNYKHVGVNECYYTSREISRSNPKFELYNGVLHKPTNNETYQPRTTIHSFNVYEGKVYDFSKLNSDLKTVVNDSNYKPVWYFGIKIPLETLNKTNKAYYVFDLYENQL